MRGEFGRKEEYVTGDWRKLCNEELHDLVMIKEIKCRRTRQVELQDRCK